jgi:dTDP-4-amino-4,6-dideoxygalactose transaminase
MITKSPCDQSIFVDKIYFTFNARTGFKHLLKNLNFKKSDKILLPAYIGITDREGSGVFDPISDLKLNFEFYRINKNFSIEKDELEYKISSGVFKAVLFIHYFGFLHCDIESVKTLCHQHNVIVIEDCAHAYSSLYKGKLLGSFGDFSFFSIHKFLATQDGGFLKINNPRFHIPALEYHEQEIRLESLQHYVKSKINEISKIRTENYKTFLNNLGQINEIEILFPNVPNGVSPLNFPIIVKNNMREKLYFFLMEEQIPTIALYYRLIHQISPKEYPASYFLANNILNLPIHQDITPDDIHLIVEKIKSFISNSLT